MSKNVDVPLTASPRKPSYQFISFVGADWAVVCGGFALLYVLMAVIPGILAIFAMVASILYAMWPIMNGRRYYVAAMNLYAKIWIAGVIGYVEWSAYAREGLTWWRRALIRMFIEPDPFPFSIDRLYHVGLLFSRNNRTDTIVIRGDGSDFSRLSPSAQADILSRLSAAISDLGAHKRLNAKIGMIVRRRPYDQANVDLQHNQHLLTNTMLPELIFRCRQRGLPLTEDNILAVASLNEEARNKELADYNCYLVAMAGKVAATTFGLDHEMFVTLTIRRSRRLQLAARTKRGKPLNPKDAQSEAIVKLADDFRDQIHDMGVQNPSILNQRELEDFARMAHDVVNIDAYRKARYDDTSENQRQTAGLCRPQRQVITGEKNCQIDDTYHMTFRIVKLPEYIYPAQMARLFDSIATDSYLTRSLTSQVVKGNKEYNVLTGLLNVLESLVATVSIFRPGKKLDLRRQGLSNLTDRLAEQEHISYFGLWYTLSSADPETFEKDIARLRRGASAVDCEIEPVEGAAWTRRATHSALYGVAQM